MAGRKNFRVKGSPASPKDLASEVNRVLEMIGGELVRLSSNSQSLQRLTDLGQPHQPNDAVRLQDLRDEIRNLKEELALKTSPSGGGGSFPPIPAESNFKWWGEVGFEETFNGVIRLFTPTEEIVVSNGRPHLLLANHQGMMEWVAGDVEPQAGFWAFTPEGKILLNPADAPLLGDYFTIVFAEVEG